MNGILVIISSILVYDMIVAERNISWKHARMYQKQKSKVNELKRTIKHMKKRFNCNN